jgi:hypothetical protein
MNIAPHSARGKWISFAWQQSGWGGTFEQDLRTASWEKRVDSGDVFENAPDG